jgi:hypothetical protein
MENDCYVRDCSYGETVVIYGRICSWWDLKLSLWIV